MKKVRRRPDHNQDVDDTEASAADGEATNNWALAMPAAASWNIDAQDSSDEAAEEAEGPVADAVGEVASGAATAVQAILACIICGARSDAARWFSVNKVYSANGKVTDIAVGNLCWFCGTGCDVYPGRSPTDIITELRKPDFKAEWDKVINAIRMATERAFKQKQVSSNSSTGIKVTKRCAFILHDVFAATFDFPPAAMGQKVITLTGPENTPISGVLVSNHNLPASVPHFDIEVFWTSDRSLQSVLLSPEDIRREGHAEDRFTHSAQRMVSGRDSALKLASLQKLPTHSFLNQRKEEILKTRVADEAKAAAQLAINDSAGVGMAATIVTSGGSALLDDDEAIAVAAPLAAAAVPGSGKKITPRKTASSGPPASGVRLRGQSIAIASLAGTPRTGSRGSAGSVAGGATARATSGTCLLSMDEIPEGTPEGADTLDLIAILQGWRCGREIKGLRNAANKLADDGGDGEKAKIETQLLLCEAARALQMNNISKPTSDLNEVTKNVHLLSLNGVSLPVPHKQLITRRKAAVYLQQGDSDAWLDCIALVGPESDEAWIVMKPRWRCCIVDSDDQERTIAEWYMSVFNDTWFRWFNNACSEDDNTGDHLAGISCSLALATAMQMEDVPAYMKVPLEVVGKMSRGFVGLLSAVPQSFEVSVEDTEYLLPASGKTTDLVKDLPTHGKSLCTKFFTNSVWTRRQKEFRLSFSAHMLQGPKVLQLQNDLDKLAHDNKDAIDIAACQRVIKDFVDNVPVWKKDMRKGATARLQATMLRLLQIAWKSVGEGGSEGNMAVGLAVKQATHVMDVTQDVRTLHQQALERLALWESAGAHQRAQAALTAYVAAPTAGQLGEVVPALQALAEDKSTLPKEITGRIQEACTAFLQNLRGLDIYDHVTHMVAFMKLPIVASLSPELDLLLPLIQSVGDVGISDTQLRGRECSLADRRSCLHAHGKLLLAVVKQVNAQVVAASELIRSNAEALREDLKQHVQNFQALGFLGSLVQRGVPQQRRGQSFRTLGVLSVAQSTTHSPSTPPYKRSFTDS